MSALNNTPPSQAPQPPQTGEGPPTMPQPGAADFDQRMRVYEAWQRDRLIEAQRASATSHGNAAETAEALKEQLARVGVEPAPTTRTALLVQLVSTMTSAQRAKPSTAVATAAALLAAIEAA